MHFLQHCQFVILNVCVVLKEKDLRPQDILHQVDVPLLAEPTGTLVAPCLCEEGLLFIEVNDAVDDMIVVWQIHMPKLVVCTSEFLALVKNKQKEESLTWSF